MQIAKFAINKQVLKSATVVVLTFIYEFLIIAIKFIAKQSWRLSKYLVRRSWEITRDSFKAIRESMREAGLDLDNPFRHHAFEILKAMESWKKQFPDGVLIIRKVKGGNFTLEAFVSKAGTTVYSDGAKSKEEILAIYENFGNNISSIYESALAKAAAFNRPVAQQVEVKQAVGANTLPSYDDADEMEYLEDDDMARRSKGKMTTKQALAAIESGMRKPSAAFDEIYDRMYDLCKDIILEADGWSVGEYEARNSYEGLCIEFSVVNRSKGIEYEGSASMHGDKELLTFQLWSGSRIAVTLGATRLKEFVGERNWKHVARNRWKNFLKEKGL